MAGLAKRLGDRAVRVCHQDGIGRLVLGDACLGFGRGELRLGCIRGGLRLLVALFGRPSIVDQVGISPLIGIRLHDYRASRGYGVALRRKRKAEVGLVDPHERLPGFDLLADIHQPLDDLAGDAKAEIALHPRADGACEPALGAVHPRGLHQADHRRLLPRVAHGRGLWGENAETDECGHPRRDHNTGQNGSSPFHDSLLCDLDFVRTLYRIRGRPQSKFGDLTGT
ncbi:hypothetical protein ABH984_006923 [Bradyrhizobium ottawaense]